MEAIRSTDCHDSNQTAALIPYGVADKSSDVAYVAVNRGLITGIDIQSGDVLTRAPFPASLLTINYGVVVAWTNSNDRSNSIRLVALVDQGGQLTLKWDQTISMPHWVDTASDNPDRFRIEARTSNSHIVVLWEARTYYEGGAYPPAVLQQQSTRAEAGRAVLDLETGALESQEQIEPDRTAATDAQTMPPGKSTVPYRTVRSWRTGSWQTEHNEALLIKPTDQTGISLIHRDPGTVEYFDEILITNDRQAVVAVTPDGSMAFVHESAAELGSSWRVVSAKTGELIGELPYDDGTEGVSVVNGKVLYAVVETRGMEHRQSLRCRDLKSKTLLWSHVLSERSTATPPPRPQ